jgi:hypothetical protein
MEEQDWVVSVIDSCTISHKEIDMVEIEDIQLKTDVQQKQRELPRGVKAIQIGERIFLFRWTYTGWRQLTIEERTEIHVRYGV